MPRHKLGAVESDPSHDRRQRLYSYTRRVLQELIASPDPLSIEDMMKLTNMSDTSIRDALNWLRGQDLAFIASWRRGGYGPMRRCWTAGKGEDAAKPKPLTQAAKSKRWRENNLHVNAMKIGRAMTLAGQLGAA